MIYQKVKRQTNNEITGITGTFIPHKLLEQILRMWLDILRNPATWSNDVSPLIGP